MGEEVLGGPVRHGVLPSARLRSPPDARRRSGVTPRRCGGRHRVGKSLPQQGGSTTLSTPSRVDTLYEIESARGSCMNKSYVSRRTVLAGSAGVFAGAALSSSPAMGEEPSIRSRAVVIDDVTVIDGTGARPKHNQRVLLRGRRIAAIGPRASVEVPRAATVVSGTGRFLIPGLADLHVHSSPLPDIFPPLYIVNGVTTVREMGANPLVSQWRQEVAAGTRIGPLWTIGSDIVDGSPSLWEGIGVPYLKVANAAEARAVVRQEKAKGADFIKTYTRLSRESFLALADEARRQRIPFLGHVPDFVSLTEASNAGIRTVEHLFQIWYDTSNREAAIRRQVEEVPIGPGEYGGWYAKMHPLEYAAARSHDRRKARRVFQHLARNGTRVTPTLSVHQLGDMPQDVDLDDPRLRYVPADLLASWEWSRREIYMKDRTPAVDAEKRELFQRRLELVAEMAEAGVRLLAGTDVGASYILPGFSLHDELQLLVRAGLSPMRALIAATAEPASLLGHHDRGTVEVGKVADLVLLDGDPLRDIRNTARINSVVVNGTLITSGQRERMLRDIRAAARQPLPAGVNARPACACHGG
ncbi:amidohydrolase family protein [Micromonospora sp. WMMD998]|uniref:amidohydrolase family protein n=1 Tax=Micromonospora sp. WMMD998 TaxID=3016092 RepID=UPI00249A3C50|nr:amidohydrolase family protein [Micromonospora sp. WMMD998]WFE37822.1 amidohydrolase family protein [Micromonospora sp. WMMD998]